MPHPHLLGAAAAAADGHGDDDAEKGQMLCCIEQTFGSDCERGRKGDGRAARDEVTSVAGDHDVVEGVGSINLEPLLVHS
jgi:hypothetical protein